MPVWFMVVPPKAVKLLTAWQDSQAAAVGRWLAGLATGVMPVKAWPLWQLAQPLLIPAWFIAVPEKAVNLVAAWQVSQAAAVGRWLAGLATGVTPVKAWPLWQVAQPLAMPLWFITPGTKLTAWWHSEQACVVGRWLLGLVVPDAVPKLVVEVWQVEQSAVVATCPAGLLTGVTPVKARPLWQVAQLATIPAWFIAVPEKAVNLVAAWQVSQAAAVGGWAAGLATGVTPVNFWPLWQVAQPPVMPLWFITPGTKLTVLWQVVQACVVGRWPLGRVAPAAVAKLLVEVWQVEQSAVVGRWLEGLATGVIPAKAWPLWQVAQPLVMPAWFITPGTKLTALWHSEQACVVGRWLLGRVAPVAVAKLVIEAWQVSQAAAVGGWAAGLATGVTPVNFWPLWQVAQPPVMPLWFITPGTKLTVLWQVVQACVVGRWPLGRVAPAAVAKLLVEVWQVEQSAVVGRWLEGLATGVIPAKAWPLWQVAQPLVMPAWFITPGTKLTALWHSEQACVVG